MKRNLYDDLADMIRYIEDHPLKDADYYKTYLKQFRTAKPIWPIDHYLLRMRDDGMIYMVNCGADRGLWKATFQEGSK